ncbi:hypothetical protein ACFWOG_14440 [Kitasatospora sp. NPDC058406]|uniref:hypothetical protein n=1 Tax=Kitasatospora sp. NPDC058406 TaxID=3346483 RepID=UPI003650B807
MSTVIAAVPAPEALAALVDVLAARAASGADATGLAETARRAFAAERPGPLPDHWWLAVPGETYEEAFTVLGLHDRIPVTVRYGLAAQEDDEKADDEKDTPEPVHRVFVTPEYAGWRLIYAESPLRETTWWPHDVVERLSAACGKAQVFYQDPFADSVIWAAAEHGALVRGYWRADDPEWTGEPFPWESLPGAAGSEGETADDDDDDDDAEPNASRVTSISAAAAGLSVDPAAITAETPVRGHGWLALTAPGAGHDGFEGAPEL